jgi:hypothetical protein
MESMSRKEEAAASLKIDGCFMTDQPVTKA